MAEKKRLRAALRKHRVPEPALFAAHAVPSVRIVPRRARRALPLGASRFGGVPDVPPDFRWPVWRKRPLVFLAQLELAEVRAPGLPRRGWLLVFYDAREQPWGFDPRDRGGTVVMHVDVPRASLMRATPPPLEPDERALRACTLTFTRTIDLLDKWEHDDAVFDRIPDEAWSRHDRAAAALAGTRGRADHHVGGHPQPIQGEMRGECQLASSGINAGSPRGYASPRAKALLRRKNAWRLLLQIDSDDVPGWMWGDLGRLYLWIRDPDLASRRFDRAWLILQCH